jgi:hypothetical protein
MHHLHVFHALLDLLVMILLIQLPAYLEHTGAMSEL